jgi:hypothetical protein
MERTDINWLYQHASDCKICTMTGNTYQGQTGLWDKLPLTSLIPAFFHNLDPSSIHMLVSSVLFQASKKELPCVAVAGLTERRTS